jgi:hypothetical protein
MSGIDRGVRWYEIAVGNIIVFGDVIIDTHLESKRGEIRTQPPRQMSERPKEAKSDLRTRNLKDVIGAYDESID